IERLQREFPQDWQAILEAGNERPPLTLRANRRANTRDALLDTFRGAGIAATPVGAEGIIVQSPKPVQQLPGFDAGAFSVQDAGAQLAAPLLRAADGMRVLDACAAPGGKSTHLAELADLSLVALDESAPRLVRVRENFARLNLMTPRVEIVNGDAGEPATWWDGRAFDRILADVPCTASGVIRRHPDGKWLRREADLAGFARQQARILDALWPLLARGGLLLYATCSLFEAENEAQVVGFVARHGDVLREPLVFASDVALRGGQLLPSLPGASHNQDGFFYALLRKD
ncbi:MAG: 16S rRNA (cytosine(967)-C(5))-methyltransferase RsmB, partial [Betaproteobacteria bacterium]